MSGLDLDAPAEEVYRALVGLDDDEFDDLMADPDAREAIIDALVVHLSSRLRPEKAEGVEAVIHVKLWDRPGGGYDHREIVISDGTCTVTHEPAHDPRITLKIRPGDLRKVVAGRAGAKRLAFRGRLRVIGDIPFAMRVTDLFDLSDARG